MKLYQIDFGHYSQKDSAYGIKGYLIGESGNDVLNWFLENDSFNDESVTTFWKEKLKYTDTKLSIARLLEFKGELHDEEVVENLSDLYYGATLYGWTEISEISESEAETLLKLAIAKRC